MLTRTLQVAILASSIVVFALDARTQMPTGTCLPVIDTTSREMVRYLDTLVTAATPEKQELRHILGLSNATAGQVVPITDDSVCTRAAIALNTIARVKRSSIPVYVTAMGSLFAVADTAARIKGGTPLWFFDASWSYLALLESF
jgi:hypothetical protein